MSDLISREAAIDTVQHAFDKETILNSFVRKVAIDALKVMPSAQPEPITIQIDHELTKDEYEKLRKDMADAPIVLLPPAQPERLDADQIYAELLKVYGMDGLPCDVYNIIGMLMIRLKMEVDA